MSRKDRQQQAPEKKPEPATEPALTTQEQPSAALDAIPVAESKHGPTAEAATEALLESLLHRLAGERDGDEAPVAVLERIIREREEYRQQLQPAHDALGKHANARGVLLSHVAGSGPSYDVGGRYRLALVTVKDGEVSISEAADVVAGVASHEMPFGLVRDHMEKRMEDYLTPEAHRS